MARILITETVPGAATREFICLGCKSIHRLPGQFARIRYNHNPNRPTIRPDLWCKIGPFKEGHPFAGQVFTCHFRITDGAIRYFTDSTHPLAGKTVDLPDFDELLANQAALAVQAAETEAAEIEAKTEDSEAVIP